MLSATSSQHVRKQTVHETHVYDQPDRFMRGDDRRFYSIVRSAALKYLTSGFPQLSPNQSIHHEGVADDRSGGGWNLPTIVASGGIRNDRLSYDRDNVTRWTKNGDTAVCLWRWNICSEIESGNAC